MELTVKGITRSIRLRRDRWIRATLQKSLRPMPIVFWQKMFPENIVGFFYHALGEKSRPHLSTYRFKSPEEFRADLIFLKDNFEVLDYVTLKRHITDGTRPLKPSCFLSFDDGLVECYDYAKDILLEMNFPATFFVSTSFLDNQSVFYRHKASLAMESLRNCSEDEAKEISQKARGLGIGVGDRASLLIWLYEASFQDEGKIEKLCECLNVDWAGYFEKEKPYMSWEQVRELDRLGFTIGSHTKDHKQLGLLENSSDLEKEIVSSCEDVAMNLDKKTVPFAFPFHAYGVDRSVLTKIQRNSEVVDLVFDATGTGIESGAIINRVCGDPPSEEEGKSNLVELAKKAYIFRVYSGVW